MSENSPYTLEYTAGALDDLAKLDKQIAARIVKKLEWLAENAGIVPHYAMKGEQWEGSYRWRIGNYRAIYEIDHGILRVLIVQIGHRSDIYDQ